MVVETGPATGRNAASIVQGATSSRLRVLGHAAALGGAGLAVALAAVLRGPAADSLLILPFAAVVGAAVFGGIGPAVLALAIALPGSELVLFDPLWTIAPTRAAGVRALAFVVAAVAVVLPLRTLRLRRAVAERAAREALLNVSRVDDDRAKLRADTDRLEAEVARHASKAAKAETLAGQIETVSQRLVEVRRDVERAAARTRRLQALTGALLRAMTPVQVGQVIVARGAAAVDADAALLGLLSPDGKTVRLESAAGYDDATLERWRLLPLDAPVPLAVSIRTAEPMWMPDLEDTGEHFPAADGASGHHTWAVLPLTLREHPIGALALGFASTVTFTDDDRAFLGLLAQQCAQALDRARLHLAERGARVRAEFAERQLSFLAEASARLAASFDYETTLASVAQLIVRDLADWCTIHVLDETAAQVRLIALAHRDPDRVALIRDMEARYPPRPDANAGTSRVIATGEPVLVPRFDNALLRERAHDDDHLALLRSLAPGSEICVPVRLRERVLGAIRIVADGSGRRYTNTDLALAEELAARAAQAIDNARLYENTREASQAKSDFLGIMSHELRTPLNAILGYADLVLLGVPEPVGDKARRHIERVRTAAQHLLQLVDEVLSYARLEAGKEVARVERVDIGTVIQESAALVRPLADRKGLALRIRLPDPPVQVETDGWKVRQILANLATNAAKFTSEGEIEITAAVSRNVRIEVRDTGIGIPPEHLEHVFEPFWQVEHSATRRFGGTGLGLGVARRLARLLGGDVTVRSTPGAGSTFTLMLPLDASD